MLYALVDFVLSYINTDFTKKLVRMSIFVLFAIIGWLCMLTGHALRGMDRVFTVYPLIEIGHFFREYNSRACVKGTVCLFVCKCNRLTRNSNNRR